MITLAEAKELKYREVLVDDQGKRWYVNGKVQTWKREEGRIRVPLKHGLWNYDALTTEDFVYDPKLKKLVCKLVTREA